MMSHSVARRPPASLIDICYLGKSIGRPEANLCFGPHAPHQAAAGEEDDELLYPPDEGESCCCSPAVERRNELVLEPLPNSGDEDASLPSSADDLPTECAGQMCEFPGEQVLEQETHDLLQTIFMLHTGTRSRSPVRTKALRTLRRVVDDVLAKHRLALNGMIAMISLDQESDEMNVIRTVAENMFSDNTTNWGRIVSLVAFGAEVSRRLKESGREHCIRAVAHQMATYLLSGQRDWLLNNKGWGGFVECFEVEDAESVVRNALLGFASMAWIGAGIAYLMR